MADEEKKGRNFIVEKFVEYRAEFRKIVWPSRPELIKHTITTIVISLIFGAFIALTDGVLGVTFTSIVSRFTS
ncbi:MAG: preprotein translocase subunit SecE [Clostridiales bacterium]|jgi:preprotein translocase subunit SecE|nr:preprotein translocase subunit SecE [Clostridiales bacterium]